MTPEQDHSFWLKLSSDDGAAAHDHLARGFPVYFQTPKTPAGVIEKLYPNGKREYVRFDLTGEHPAMDIPCPENITS
ncbi:hypothetical protein C6Q17_24010 [Burkholderia contaminans]|nr:hypothetical protein C6Q17_24010 [Burkholderia contaminans]